MCVFVCGMYGVCVVCGMWCVCGMCLCGVCVCVWLPEPKKRNARCVWLSDWHLSLPGVQILQIFITGEEIE